MNLEKIRTEKGLTQISVAESVGVTSQAICNYEKGIREPSLYTLKRLASVLDCTVDELLADGEENESDNLHHQ